MFNLESSIGDVLKHPVGNEIITIITEQMKIPYFTISNPLIKRLKIKNITALSKGNVNTEFLEVFCNLLNQETEHPDATVLHERDKRHRIKHQIAKQRNHITPKWWKEVVAYQIYPRSFKDSNGDGIGDLGGIIEKLDYLKDLGINLLWISPVYDSPNDDNGYDIRDYYKIMDEFGTMNDFDQLLEEAHKRGIRLIMDLVINHTSDEHVWFQEAKKSEDNPYRNYYFWRKGKEVPNNWESFFSGSAWNYYENTDSHALHLFSKKQMDLNWEHKPMRDDIYKMIRYWLDKGIDGFRLDVISFISKPESLPSGSPFIGELVNAKGSEHYFFGPNLHNYLSELRRETFDHYDVVTIGETPGIGLHMSELLSREDRGELDMVFNFHHMENPGKSRFDNYLYNLNHLKKVYMHWQSKYSTLCWNSLFYENHDTPRMLSKIDPTGKYREPLAKLLAMIQLTLRGTPFLYQGQELGLLNGDFDSIDAFRDVESINLYREFIDNNIPEKEALRRIRQCSRDNGRITMPWSNDSYHGFSTTRPWIEATSQGPEITCESEITDPNSVYHFYKQLIHIRKDNPTLIYGKIKFVHGHKNLFAYYRRKKNQYYIEANLSNTKIKSLGKDPSKLILSNYDNKSNLLYPYECRLYQLN